MATSAIKPFLDQIQSAIYGEQVRSAIINAISTCYSNVNDSTLIRDGITAVIDEYLDDGTISSQIVTSVAYTKQEVDTMIAGVDISLTAEQKAALIALLD